MPDCPSCGAPGGMVGTAVRWGRADMTDVYPHLRLEPGTMSGFVDIGWLCQRCGWRWGFEVLTDDYCAAHPGACPEVDRASC